MPGLEAALASFGMVSGASSLVLYGIVVYFVLQWDARREGSLAVDDDQIGLKTVVANLAFPAIIMLMFGLYLVIRFLLTFDDFDSVLHDGVPAILSGGIFTGASLFVILPRTNVEDYPKVKRVLFGSLTLMGGLGSIIGTYVLFNNLFDWKDWDSFANVVASLIVFGPVTLGSFIVFGRASGLSVEDDSGAGGGGGGYPTQMTSPSDYGDGGGGGGGGAYSAPAAPTPGPASGPGAYSQTAPQQPVAAPPAQPRPPQPQQPQQPQQGQQQNWAQQNWDDQSGGGGGGGYDPNSGGGSGGGGQGWG